MQERCYHESVGVISVGAGGVLTGKRGKIPFLARVLCGCLPIEASFLCCAVLCACDILKQTKVLNMSFTLRRA